MIANRLIREKARNSLGNKLFGDIWLAAVLLIFLNGVILSVPGSLGGGLGSISPAFMASVGTILFALSVIVAGPLEYSVSHAMVALAREGRKPDISDLLISYKEALTDSVVLGILRSVFIWLWSLLFVIPGIIKTYAYSMAFYIQQDSSDKSWRSCLDRSQAMMKGYKWKLFCLDFSFIGWYILGFFCFGVGTLWVSSYHSASRAHFYEELRLVRADVLGDVGKIGVTEEEAEAPAETEAPETKVFALNEPAETPAEPAEKEAPSGSEEKQEDADQE
ncbi:MAG: DUF975 family protein [Clostridia bacterium]|nr:DUF975 family protein [Clostridia bacterium]